MTRFSEINKMDIYRTFTKRGFSEISMMDIYRMF